MTSAVAGSLSERAAVDAELRRVLERPGPYLTVHHSGPELSSTTLDDLVETGQIPSVHRDLVLDEIGRRSSEDVGLVTVLVAADGTVHSERHTAEIDGTAVHLGAVPYLTPLVEARARDVEHVVVEAAPGVTSVHRFAAVESERRELGPAEDPTVPGTLADLVVGAELVVVVGDEALTWAIEDALGRRLDLRTTVRRITADLADADEVATRTAAAVDDHVARRVVSALVDFRVAREAGQAVEGVDATLAALRRRQVAHLLVHDDPDDQRWACVSPDDPSQIAGPSDPGAESGLRGRLADTLVVAALASGARVTVIPAVDDERGPSELVGAVLDPTTT